MKANLPLLKSKGILKLVLIVTVFLNCSCVEEKSVELTSPDGLKTFTFHNQENSGEQNGIPFSVNYGDEIVLLPSILELSSDKLDFNQPFLVEKIERSEVRDEWHSNFSELSTVPDNYNQIIIALTSGASNLNLIGRAYNEGIAFAYEIPEQNGISALQLDESIHYNFTKNHQVWSTPKRGNRVLTAQGEYKKIPLSELQEGCERPLLIDMGDSLKVALAEAKLVDYARLSFNKGTSSKHSIVSTLDGKMGEQKQDTVSGAIIADRKKTGFKVLKNLPFQSPWRVVMMGESEAELLENNYIIQNLNDPVDIADTSWIIPGKVLRETTLTTNGGFAAIDFVANHNMQYVLFDAGWYGNEMDNASDATTITLDPKRSKGPFDIEAITKYAKEKNIGVILYVNRRALEKQLDEVLPLFKKWGVAGIKYGFVRVGDQDATAWMHEAVKKAAAYEMIIDVHDEYRPTGFSRTYPNFLTQEGIRGDEETVPNDHTLITMFTRMLAGAADNTVCYYNSRVDTMGSRASQLAKTVCIFSPLQFLYWYDKPSDSPEKLDGLWGDSGHIGIEPELEFFDAVPTTWDETKVLKAEIGEIGVIARRKGTEWFIGGINGKQPKSFKLYFSFLEPAKNYTAKVYTDDETVETRTKVNIEEIEVNSTTVLNMEVAANNGFALHVKLN